MARYEHTQVSYAMLGVMTALAAFIWIRTGASWFGLSIWAFLAAMWLVFGRLTTTVADGEVTCAFGVTGWPRRVYRLRDVQAATRVRNTPFAGWGMRWTPGGWLWNVWGLDAVELHLANGVRFRIGTDEPDALLQALQREGVGTSETGRARVPGRIAPTGV